VGRGGLGETEDVADVDCDAVPEGDGVELIEALCVTDCVRDCDCVIVAVGVVVGLADCVALDVIDVVTVRDCVCEPDPEMLGDCVAV
jgi:hypothetical protein